ncbi:MAG TPA: hypothetical protein VNW49_12110 [Puia sp.]|jgi:hypothetical protein|nr:hypothetical protein [Puia sp.]
MKSEFTIRKSIRRWILFFMAALILSGITAFALESELAWMDHFASNRHSSFSFWIHKVYIALKETNIQYPFLAYGYDWLAFAHLVIAVAFYGVFKDPVKNKWIIQFGRISCCMIFPLAFIAGHVRGIPFYWQMIDCGFGIVGLIPLTICYRKIEQMEFRKSRLDY